MTRRKSSKSSATPARLIVADAGPVIALVRVEGLPFLSGVADRVLVPESVVKECTNDLSRPGARAIGSALDRGLLDEYRGQLRDWSSQRTPPMGAGEIDAIGAALALGVPVLMDERAARS